MMLKTLVVKAFDYKVRYGLVQIGYTETSDLMTSDSDIIESINFYNNLLSDSDIIEYELLDEVNLKEMYIWQTVIDTDDMDYRITINGKQTEKGLL